MKKILFSLLMLFGMTAAWAGTGDGSKEHSYFGEWRASLQRVRRVSLLSPSWAPRLLPAIVAS